MLLTFILSLFCFYISLSVHEASHAFVAYKLGDPTAKIEGRMTLNPLAHIDLIGTVLVPIFLIFTGIPAFGWAKPVMVDPRNFNSPVRDNFLTAISGPLSNLIFAVLVAVTLKAIPNTSLFYELGVILVSINVLLAVFNLIPVPPLDGSKVWHFILSDEAYFTLERMGPYILLAVLFVLFMSGNIFFNFVSTIANFLVNKIV